LVFRVLSTDLHETILEIAPVTTNMQLPFTKMHGLGNDFVVFDFTKSSHAITRNQAIHIADRHFGIGCDQILIVEQSERDKIDFKYRILNADGGEVGQCGNGARCFALFVREQGLCKKSTIHVETLSGDLVLELADNSNVVTVNMGIPNFEPSHIPLRAEERQATYSAALAADEIEFSALSIGNPHAVITVDDIDSSAVERLGPVMESHSLFPERANIGFMQIINRDTIKLRVYERGSGETIACGSGACAAVASGIASGKLNNTVLAHLSGGKLEINWPGEGQPVMMAGLAQTVFHGEIDLKNLSIF